jgi:3-deoxy-manno-octulosonate cytidylyltransferase (CMP-KDO synthetase)
MAATRLPGKPLVDICGKPMIQWVWERARGARTLDEVLVVTPDEEIVRAVEGFGGRAVVTSASHRSGTDRLAEAAQAHDADVIVNIQGDEPLIEPGAIDAAAEPLLRDPALQMTSLMARCPGDQLDNPATVKVVCAADGSALYFSRLSIPFRRGSEQTAPVMQHIGLYAYRRSFLLTYAALPPTPLERTEVLEQLRVLESGYRIRMVEIGSAPLSVDTPTDLAVARRTLADQLCG